MMPLLNQTTQDSLGHVRVMLALQSELGLAFDESSIQNLSSLPKIVEHLRASKTD